MPGRKMGMSRGYAYPALGCDRKGLRHDGRVPDGGPVEVTVRTVVWAVAAFGIGTLPSPWVIAKLAGRRDVIEEMERRSSPGDAHFLVVRRMSGRLGVVAIVLDMLKGFVPALVARLTHQSPATLAWIGAAAVAGHCFAPFLRPVGGRGLTTAAGVSLVIVPKAMIVSGVIALAGTVGRVGGFGTSVGFGLLPVFAIAFGYRAPLVWMTVAIVGLIALRRLEGLGEDRRAGVPLRSALVGRLLFDLPRGRHA
jgi:acyl phosphate:glycerol-3-phosphate acyltransferase